MRFKLKSCFFMALSLVLAPLQSHADGPTIRYDAKPGASKVRIEGTSSVHDWQMESVLVGGHLDAGAGFPVESGQPANPGPVNATVEAIVPVRSLKSLEKDGSHYSDKMDEIVWDKLSQTNHPRILYYLTELTLKEGPKAKDAPYTFDSKGDLIIGGVTNRVSMPVYVTPLDGRIKLAGEVTVRMSDFKIQAPKLSVFGIGFITTEDQVKLFFEWVVARKEATGK